MDVYVCCGSHLECFLTNGMCAVLLLQKPKTTPKKQPSDFGQGGMEMGKLRD